MGNRIPVAADVRITIQQVGADLRVRGWSNDEIKIDGDVPRVKVEEDGKAVSISASGDCDVYVPERATLNIERVGADAKITEVFGDLSIGSVGANLDLRGVGNVTIGTVDADTLIRRVEGAVQIDRVGADATLHNIVGNVHINWIGSDAYLRDVEGGCVVGQVGADLILGLDFKPGNEYSFSAMADIVCRVGPKANVQFILHQDTTLVINTDERAQHDEENHRVLFGAGEAIVQLHSPGEVRLVDEDGDSEPLFGNAFEHMFDFDVERVFEETARATERARRDAERVSAQIQREVERAAEQMRRKAERTAEKAHREAEKMQRGKGKGFSFGWSWGDKAPMGFRTPQPPMPPRPPMPPNAPQAPRAPSATVDEPVTDNERLTILRMVEAKQITVEEAERLLAALEGRA